VRPKDGVLYGLSSTGRIVTINPVNGAVTAKATLAADPADRSSPYSNLIGTGFAVDFDPSTDRLRVISDAGQNLRINVDTGATITDNAVNNAGVTAAAYSNSYAGAITTVLYDISTGGGNLVMQTPPDDGVLVNVGSLGANAVGDVAMDIAGGANGLALAALRGSFNGASVLYRVDLATGAAVPVNGAGNLSNSAIGNGQVSLVDLAIALK